MVGAAVVGQSVVVEGFSHGVAPVSVFRTDGGGDGVSFAFAYQSGTVGVHQVLQDAGSGVVARDEEHLVERHYGSLRFSTFLAQCVVFCFFAAVTCHAFVYLPTYFIVNGLGKQAYQGEHSFAGCR